MTKTTRRRKERIRHAHMVLPIAFCSAHAVCCLSFAIFAKKKKKLIKKLPLWTNLCKDGLVSKLLLLYYKGPYVSASVDTRTQSGSTAETCGMVG